MISDCSGPKNLQIRGQCTPRGTRVASQMSEVPIRNMALPRKDDVGVQYAVTIQQIHRIVEGK